MTTSGTSTFELPFSEILFETFDRLQIRSAEITADHIKSFRRSANLIQARWSNRVPNLWEVDQQTIPLVAGQTTYVLPSSTIAMLDVYVRLYQLGSPVDVTPSFTTSLGSATVIVNQPGSGISAGNYLQIVVPVSVGGIVLQGYYQAVSVTGTNSYTITAASVATSAVVNGGVVPFFTTTANSTSVSVNLPNHGYLSGQQFTVQVQTNVGGLVLFGSYTISSVTDADNLIITSPYAAGSNATAYENDGQTQIAVQSVSSAQITAQPALTDRILYAISRDDYAAIPNKSQQGVPNTYWFNRTSVPSVTIWNVPDDNGPYELIYYRMRKMDDASVLGGISADVPTYFLEAYCAEIAAHLAIKWKPDAALALMAYAKEVWQEAAVEDREHVPLHIAPSFSGYF